MTAERAAVESAITVLKRIHSTNSVTEVDTSFRIAKSDEPVACLLDALAKICVSNAGQAFATSIALQPDCIILFVTANTKETLQPYTFTEFLMCIWGSLWVRRRVSPFIMENTPRTLTEYLMYIRASLTHTIQASRANVKGTLPHTLPQHLMPIWASLIRIAQTSMTIPLTDSQALQDHRRKSAAELGAMVYAHSSAKITHIINKRYAEFQNFLTFFREGHSNDGAALANLKSIENLIRAWRTVTSLHPSERGEYWETFGGIFYDLHQPLQTSIDNWLRHEVAVFRYEFAAQLKNASENDPERLTFEKNSTFDLQRYIKKIFSFQHHIQNLLDLAYSPRNSSMFDKSLSIKLIDPLPSVPQGPITDDTAVEALLRASYESICPNSAPEPETTDLNSPSVSKTKLSPSIQEAIDQLVTEFRDKPQTGLENMPRHAECTLLCYHRANPDVVTSAYVGVSKLACFGCRLYFAASNSTTIPFHMYLKGNHASAQVHLWRSPLEENERELEIHQKMLGQIHKVLGKVIENKAVNICRARDGMEQLETAKRVYKSVGIDSLDDDRSNFLAELNDFINSLSAGDVREDLTEDSESDSTDFDDSDRLTVGCTDVSKVQIYEMRGPC